jgi:penicillin-binding protein 1A
MGITPNLATGVWVGWEDRAAHFRGTGEGQGAKMALPVWAIYMKKVWANKDLEISPEDKFVKPSNWTGSCTDLQGLGGYGDEGALQTIDEIKNPKAEEPVNIPKRSPAKKEENVNEKINSGEEIDFNK